MSTPSVKVVAEIHGFSAPDAEPVPWSVGLDQVGRHRRYFLAVHGPSGLPRACHAADRSVARRRSLVSTGPQERKAKNLARNPACILTTGCSDLAEGALDVVLEGVAEQVTDDAELRPVAAAHNAKYGTQTWDYVVSDGAFAHRSLGGRAIVFRVRPVRGLGFRKGDTSSRTTWRFEGRACPGSCSVRCRRRSMSWSLRAMTSGCRSRSCTTAASLSTRSRAWRISGRTSW